MKFLRAFAIGVVVLSRGCMPTPAPAAEVPERALEHLPVLVSAQRAVWPDAYEPWYLAGLVEQETCPSLKHKKCWNPRTELRTSRERGVGLGQFTKAYRDDGSVRFDKLTELVQTHQSLRGWSWENWHEPRFQLTAVVEMNRGIYRRIPDAASDLDRLAFTLSAYNGGEGGLRQDRLLCRNTDGCSPSKWFGHVEKNSTKRRMPFPGYRTSPFQINREYVVNVIHVRRQKYEQFFGKLHADQR